jgi:hypothetical protein
MDSIFGFVGDGCVLTTALRDIPITDAVGALTKPTMIKTRSLTLCSYVLLAGDCTAARSIIAYKHDEDKASLLSLSLLNCRQTEQMPVKLDLVHAPCLVQCRFISWTPTSCLPLLDLRPTVFGLPSTCSATLR